MLFFIFPIVQAIKMHLPYLNTSHVILYLRRTAMEKLSGDYLNTSHVILYRSSATPAADSALYLNTSHVILYLLNTGYNGTVNII